MNKEVVDKMPKNNVFDTKKTFVSCLVLASQNVQLKENNQLRTHFRHFYKYKIRRSSTGSVYTSLTRPVFLQPFSLNNDRILLTIFINDYKSRKE